MAADQWGYAAGMLSRRVAPFVVLAGLALSGCGQHEVDLAKWRSDLKEAGSPVTDAEALQGIYVGTEEDPGVCSRTGGPFELFVELSRMPEDVLRVNFKNACPERVKDFEKAFKGR